MDLVETTGVAQLAKIDLILAVDLNNGMGKDCGLPWRLPNEYAHFNKMTGTPYGGKKPAIIMGRRTWLETEPHIEEFLKTRIVVVVSRTLAHAAPGVHICRSYDEAITLLTSKPLVDQVSKIWNVGGAQIARLGVNHPTFRRLYLTKIYERFDCDTYFPEDIDLAPLKRVNDPDVPQGPQQEGGVRWEVHVYEKTVNN